MQAVALKRTQQPRTILAFLAIVVGLLLGAAAATIAALAASGQSTYLIPWILLLVFTFIIVLVVVVIVLTVKDPSKLQLGQVTGEEYQSIQEWRKGDSIRGESLATSVPVTLRAAVLPVALPAGATADPPEEPLDGEQEEEA